MRRFDRALVGVDQEHKRENYIGPMDSTGNSGRTANINNLNGSQIRNAKVVMPYGISSRGGSGLKAQAVVNGHSDNAVIGVYDPSRPNVGVGEIKLYSYGGSEVHLTNTGELIVSTDECEVSLDSTGDITIVSNSTGSRIVVGSDGINVSASSSTITIDVSGKVSITATNKVQIDATSDVSISSASKIQMTSGGDIDMTCSNLKVNGQTMIVP